MVIDRRGALVFPGSCQPETLPKLGRGLNLTLQEPLNASCCRLLSRSCSQNSSLLQGRLGNNRPFIGIIND